MEKARSKRGEETLRTPLPKPMELAKLAAILSPDAEPKPAMERAMKFYVEATIFLPELAQKLAADSDALMAYASDERRRERFVIPTLRVKWAEARADTLELDPQAHDDPAREYLREQYGFSNLKKAKTVLDNFRRFHNVLPKASDGRPVVWAIDKPDCEGVIKSWEREKDGRTVHSIPRSALNWLGRLVNARRTDQKVKSWHKSRPKAAKKSVKKNLEKSRV